MNTFSFEGEVSKSAKGEVEVAVGCLGPLLEVAAESLGLGLNNFVVEMEGEGEGVEGERLGVSMCIRIRCRLYNGMRRSRLCC